MTTGLNGAALNLSLPPLSHFTAVAHQQIQPKYRASTNKNANTNTNTNVTPSAVTHQEIQRKYRANTNTNANTIQIQIQMWLRPLSHFTAVAHQQIQQKYKYKWHSDCHISQQFPIRKYEGNIQIAYTNTNANAKYECEYKYKYKYKCKYGRGQLHRTGSITPTTN